MKPSLWIIQFQGDRQLKRKDNPSQGSLWRLRARLRCRIVSSTGYRNINLFPFWHRANRTWIEEFPYVLGPSNPWPITVLMEPFSTSAFKVLIWIIATTTKICTESSSTSTHVTASTLLPRPLTHQSFIFTLMVMYRHHNIAPSIFRADSFGRWVVRHSLADSYFQGHRPAVLMNQLLFWCPIIMSLGALTSR